MFVKKDRLQKTFELLNVVKISFIFISYILVQGVLEYFGIDTELTNPFEAAFFATMFLIAPESILINKVSYKYDKLFLLFVFYFDIFLLSIGFLLSLANILGFLIVEDEILLLIAGLSVLFVLFSSILVFFISLLYGVSLKVKQRNNQKSQQSKIVVVNERDEVVGRDERISVNKTGKIGRIIRIFLVNSAGQIFLQKRKLPFSVGEIFVFDQSAGGHVDEEESYEQAAYRELEEELGVSGVKLAQVTNSSYYAEENYMKEAGWIFKRFNMIYTGIYEGEFKFQGVLEDENIIGGEWLIVDEIQFLIKTSPEKFTKGFPLAFEKFLETQSKKL